MFQEYSIDIDSFRKPILFIHNYMLDFFNQVSFKRIRTAGLV